MGKNKRKPKGYWILEKCKSEVLNYNSRSELKKNNSGLYDKIIKSKNSEGGEWLDMFNHMELLGNKQKRYIYACEFSDGSCYIGLTYNIKKRFKKHLVDKSSQVYKHIEKTGELPTLVTKSKLIDVTEASKLEGEILNEYENNNWIILNLAKTGGIGGNGTFRKWDYDSCKKEALLYMSRYKFQQKSAGAYHASRRGDWLDEICNHMNDGLNFLTKDWCRKKALRYSSRWEFGKNCVSEYTTAVKNKWLDDICKHMKPVYKTLNYDSCKKESLKYKSRTEFYKKSQSSYNHSRINGWLDELFPKK